MLPRLAYLSSHAHAPAALPHVLSLLLWLIRGGPDCAQVGGLSPGSTHMHAFPWHENGYQLKSRHAQHGMMLGHSCQATQTVSIMLCLHAP